jgi:hypothetical protein
MNHMKESRRLYEAAVEAVEAVAANTNVSPEVTLECLEELDNIISMSMDALRADITERMK